MHTSCLELLFLLIFTYGSNMLFWAHISVILDSDFVLFVVVNGREEGVVATYLPIKPLIIHSGLEPEPQCKPIKIRF